MAANVYECMFLLDSNKYARDQANCTSRLHGIVEKCEGEMLASRLWNEQKLAYPINGQRKGTYWLTYFRMDTERVTEFNRECQLNSHLLRHLLLKVHPRLVDTLVAHARGELPAAPEAEAEAKPAEAKPKEAAEATATAAKDAGDEAAKSS